MSIQQRPRELQLDYMQFGIYSQTDRLGGLVKHHKFINLDVIETRNAPKCALFAHRIPAAFVSPADSSLGAMIESFLFLLSLHTKNDRAVWT